MDFEPSDKVKLLSEQINQFKPELAVVYDADRVAELKRMLPSGEAPLILSGAEGYRAAAALPSIDMPTLPCCWATSL